MQEGYHHDHRTHGNRNYNDNRPAIGSKRSRRTSHHNHHQGRKRRFDQSGGDDPYIHDDEQRVLVLKDIPPDTTWRDILNNTDQAQFVHVDRETQKAFVKLASHQVAAQILQGHSWKYQSHLVGLHPTNMIDTNNNQNYINGNYNKNNKHSNTQSSTTNNNENGLDTFRNNSPSPEMNRKNDENANNDRNFQKEDKTSSSTATATATQLPGNNDQQNIVSKKSSTSNNTMMNSNSSNKKYFARSSPSSLSSLEIWEQKKQLLEKRESMYQKQLALHKQIYEKQSSKTTSKLKEILTLQTKINSLKKEIYQHLQQKPKQQQQQQKQVPFLYSLDKRTTTLVSPYTSEEELVSFLQTTFPQYSLKKHYNVLLLPPEVNDDTNSNNNDVNKNICVKSSSRIIAEKIKAQTEWNWYNLPISLEGVSKEKVLHVDPDNQNDTNSAGVVVGEGAVVSLTTLHVDHDNNVDCEEGDDILVDYDDYDED